MSLSSALTASDNTVFAQLGADVGPDKVRQAAYDMGITSHLDAYYAESIGGLRYGRLPAGDGERVRDGPGRRLAQHGDGDREGRAPGRHASTTSPERDATRMFTDGEAFEVIPLMETVLTAGTAAGQGIGCPNGGKTGTTSNNTDAWFVGITPRLSTAVWVGYPNETTTLGSSVFGGTIAAPIWHDFMTVAKGDFCGDWPEPKEPFQGQAFFGTYAGASGGSSDDARAPTTARATRPTARRPRTRRRLPAAAPTRTPTPTRIRRSRLRAATPTPPPSTGRRRCRADRLMQPYAAMR